MLANEHFSVTPLDSILNASPEAIQTLHKELVRKGWAVVSLPDRFVGLTQDLSPQLQDFFSSEYKNKSLYLGKIGWSNSTHKEVLHYTTGTSLSIEKIPESFRETFVKLSNEFDDTLARLVKATSEPIFHLQENDWKQKEFPFLHDPTDHPNRFNMLDVAYYKNAESPPANAQLPTQNCVAHHDPGLISLSIYQSSPGLQLFDPESNLWYDGPLGYEFGLIWTGQAASDITQGELKSGVHQVVYPATLGTPRLSIWAELCTSEQTFSTKNMKWNENCTKIVIPNVFGSKPYIVPVMNGDLSSAIKTAERLLGMPRSKVMLRPSFNEDGEVIGFNR